MKTVSVVCEKGGTGKTTLSKELYEGMRRKGLKVSLYSLDGQYKGRTIKDPEAEVEIVDTQGVLSSDLSDIVRESDLVLVPVRPTPNDLEPFVQTVQLIHDIDPQKPIQIVVNGYNRYRIASSFMEWLTKNDWSGDVLTIPQSEIIVQAQPGQSAVDIAKKSKAAEAIQKMIDRVFELLNI